MHRPPPPMCIARPVTAALALALLAALLTACGPRITRPVCQQRYADCTDACAERCDRRMPGTDREEASSFESNDPAHADCATCVQQCREAAERCDRQLPPSP